MKFIIDILKYLFAHKDQVVFFGTFITAAGGLWGLFNVVWTFHRNSQDRRDKILSEAITLFTQGDNSKQLSALQILCTQCRYSFEQVFYLCANECDVAIRSTLTRELERWSTRHISFLQNINTEMSTCYLRKRRYGSENNIALSYRGILILKNGNPLTKTELNLRDKVFLGGRKDNNPVNIESMLFLSSYLLTEALCKRRVHLLIKNKVQLFYMSEFYNEKLEHTTFDHCVMIDCVSRQLTAYDVRYQKCQNNRDSLKQAKYVWCHFQSCSMCSADLKMAQFIRCNFDKMAFRNQTDLSKAYFFRCTFTNEVEFADGKYNHIRFVNCTFERISIDVAEMKEVSFVNCTMKKLRIRKSQMIGTFDDCDIGTSIFEECSMNGTKFRNCTFAQGHLYGNDMGSVTFLDCRFTEKIELCKNKNTDRVMVRETLKSTTSTRLADCPHFYEGQPKESPAGYSETK